jgi:uncharacterized protein YtpQ (UPF0354 family)
MAAMPQHPEAFSEQVRIMLERMRPDLEIDLGGVHELLVDGRRLDLENLFRMVSQDPDRGVEIVEQYLDHLFAGEAVSASAMPLELARQRIMPRIQPESIFQRLSREQVAHVPWVNDTVLVFVIDLPHVTVSVTTEQMVRWGVAVDDLEDIARQNLAEFTPKLPYRLIEHDSGGKAAIIAEQDGYDAARLLLSGLHKSLAPQLGGDFLVATPARDVLVAVSCDPTELVQKVHEKVERDFRRMPYPISDRWFYVTRDGVAGTETEQGDSKAA